MAGVWHLYDAWGCVVASYSAGGELLVLIHEHLPSLMVAQNGTAGIVELKV